MLLGFCSVKLKGRASEISTNHRLLQVPCCKVKAPRGCHRAHRRLLPKKVFGLCSAFFHRGIPSDIVIYFSLTEAPLPDPTQHPETDPKRSQTDPKRSQTEPKRSRNGAKRSQNGPKSSFSGWDGRGVCRGRGGGGL